MAILPRICLLVAALSVAIGATADAELSQSVPEGVSIRFKKEYYDVLGNTWREIRADIARNERSIPGTNERFEGITRYEVVLEPRRGACSPTTATLVVDLAMIVPRVRQASRLQGEEKACWALYDRTLTDHEELHLQLAIRDMQDLLSEIRSSQKASCDDLRRLVQRRVEDLRRSQDAYDRISNHGLQQWQAWGLNEEADPDAAGLRQRCTLIAREPYRN